MPLALRCITWAVWSGFALVPLPGGADEPPVVAARQIQVLSPVYKVERIYRSMQGPMSTQPLRLPRHRDGDPELLWITGYDAVMVGRDGSGRVPQEFMCHSNLDLGGDRLFTLSQGQQSIRFPPGFGVPVMSGDELSLTTQVLNHNLPNPDLEVRHKITLHYLRDSEAMRPMRPLMQRGVYAMASLDGRPAHYGVNVMDLNPERHGPGCLTARQASDSSFTDQFGRRFTGHWLVPPGREVNRSLVTRLLDLSRDTRIHYIAVHLHPYAEFLELRDRTSDSVVFRSRVKPLAGRIGISSVEYYRSAEGLPLHYDHEYELVSTYNNTGKAAVDSMAVMYLYLLDDEFDKHRFIDQSLRAARQAGGG